MKITFEFKALGNAAFQDDSGFQNARAHEIARIIRTTADFLEGSDLRADTERVLLDYNGNRVGTCTVEGE